jgi:hypothetical protein
MLHVPVVPAEGRDDEPEAAPQGVAVDGLKELPGSTGRMEHLAHRPAACQRTAQLSFHNKSKSTKACA